MSQHQHDTNCNELWLYFQTVINWVKATFPKYRSKLMKGLEWGIFYNKYGTGKYDPKALEARIIELIEDYRNGYLKSADHVNGVCKISALSEPDVLH